MNFKEEKKRQKEKGRVETMRKLGKRVGCLVLSAMLGIVGNGAIEDVQNKMISYAATTEDIRLKGIDVSHHQGEIDWEAVKGDGIDFAIIRCGYGQDIASQNDKYWKANADGCTKYGIPFGTYLYSYATTPERAIGEAKHVLRLVKGYNLQYPIYLDIEDSSQSGLTAKQLAAIAKAFVETIEEAGYEAGIYAGYNWHVGYLTEPDFDNWDRWVARYNSYCGYNRDYNMWQYSSKGTVAGINGNVDMDYLVGTDVAAEVRGVSVTETSKTVEKGEIFQLTYSVAPLNAYEKKVKWSSENTNIVSVAEDGTVTATGAGSAQITASSVEDSSITASCVVTVNDTSATDTPDTSTGPVITEIPNVSTGQAVTETPNVSAEPTATEEPTITIGAAATVTPNISEEPLQTKEPVETVKPEETIAPQITNTPEVTSKPEETAEVIVTATPNTTESEATTTPNVTATPEITVAPTASVTPDVTNTPSPTTTSNVKVGKSKSVTYQAVTKNQIKINWKKVSGVDGYRLYYYNTSTKKDVLVAKVSASQTSYTVTKVKKKTLKPGTKYTFKLAAYKMVEKKRYDGEKVKVNTITKPDTVKITKVTRTNSKKAKIQWKTVSAAKGYVVYLSTSKSGTYRAVATVTGSKTKSYTITGLKKGTTYYVRVCAYQKLGNKTWYGNYYQTKKIAKK